MPQLQLNCEGERRAKIRKENCTRNVHPSQRASGGCPDLKSETCPVIPFIFNGIYAP